MNLRQILPAFLVVMVIALGGVSHAHADYTLWAPTNTTDQTLFSFNLNPQNCTMNGDLYMNAAGATQGISDAGNALLLSIVAYVQYSGTDFTIQNIGGTWDVFGPTGNFLLNLGSTNQFGLYYIYSGWLTQPTITQVSGLPDQWVLNTTDNCLPVELTDADPVTPIPASILLMGSGLAGVFGFRRRFPW